MAEYSDRDRRVAEQIINQILERENRVPESRDRENRALELEDDIVIYDIELDAIQFSDDLYLLRDIGIDVPAMRLEEVGWVPISLKVIWGSSGWSPLPSRGRRRWWRYFRFPEFVEDMYESIARSVLGTGDFQTMRHGEAQQVFARRATDFLATRIATVRLHREGRDRGGLRMPAMLNLWQRYRGPRVTTPGCYFTVTTNSNGLRVFWSGAYYISPNFFNHPTSPVTGVLQSGIYVFGVDGGVYTDTVQWDNSAIVSLPGNPHIHLPF